jgi:hypothetical protein
MVSPNNTAFSRHGGIRVIRDASSADRYVERFFHRDREPNCVGYRILYPTPRFCRQRRMPKRVVMLCRGWRYRPEVGAHRRLVWGRA